MNLSTLRTLTTGALLSVALLPLGCSGGGGGAPGSVQGTSGDFVVLNTTPLNNGTAFLNDPVEIEFSNPVDLTSVNLNTFSVTAFDLQGNPLPEQPLGLFEVQDATGVPGGNGADRRLVFLPRFPTNASFDNGGLKPGRRYVVTLVGGDARNQTVIRDQFGQALASPISFEFRTRDGSTPEQLFRDRRAGGPRLTSDPIVTPRNASNEVELGKLSLGAVEVRLQFNQPLNPDPVNLPVDITSDPVQRIGRNPGRIFMEFDNASGQPEWIPATVDLEVNRVDSAEVVLRPIGLLPNNADVRVIVESTVEDLSGESNTGDILFNRIAGTFSTVTRFEPQFDALIEEFDLATSFDPEAPFLEPQARLLNGRIGARFDFEGSDTRLDYRPTVSEVALNTDFTQITPSNGPAFNVTGGEFRFRNVTIPAGVSVRGTGSRPMTWLISGDLVVNGTLSVDGGEGNRVSGLMSANLPIGGGIGVCGGGNGGVGSPNALDRSPVGQAGAGPGQRPAEGGAGGRMACPGASVGAPGAGGGGGSFATQGDPDFLFNPNQGPWPAISGRGNPGIGGALQGAPAGPMPWRDQRSDNNFWGAGINIAANERVVGELLVPQGGSGGGAGGDSSSDGTCFPSRFGFITDERGGGGGGGAGVLIVKVLGQIEVGPFGRISAIGGSGGGGEAAGSSLRGGGGGSGSGGMVVLMAGAGMTVHVHSTTGDPLDEATYGERDASFAISADGNVCRQSNFNTPIVITSKYEAFSSPASIPIPLIDTLPAAGSWGSSATAPGGFGGMGIVQLHMPPGRDADGTGNRLDDAIRFVIADPGTGELNEVSAARKVELLNWRGWKDSRGRDVDDLGQVIADRRDGDIRPAPIMLPSPFAAVSRARSRWIDTGASVRQRVDSAGPGSPPGVVQAPAGEAPRPDYEFGGLSQRGSDLGYARFDEFGQLAFDVPDGLEDSYPVVSSTTDTFEGQAAYRIDLPAGSLGTVSNRYANYRAEVLATIGAPLQEFRILGHDDRQLWLAADAVLPDGFVAIRVLEKFFAVFTNQNPGFGETYEADGALAPIANVRIGFAFSTDPGNAGEERFPAQPGEFAYDLSDPAVQSFLDTRRPAYVQWDVLFNTRYHPSFPNNDSGVPLTPSLPLSELTYLVLPYRF